MGSGVPQFEPDCKGRKKRYDELDGEAGEGPTAKCAYWAVVSLTD
jgi:hypothetical protein